MINFLKVIKASKTGKTNTNTEAGDQRLADSPTVLFLTGIQTPWKSSFILNIKIPRKLTASCGKPVSFINNHV